MTPQPASWALTLRPCSCCILDTFLSSVSFLASSVSLGKRLIFWCLHSAWPVSGDTVGRDDDHGADRFRSLKTEGRTLPDAHNTLKSLLVVRRKRCVHAD